MNKWAYQACHLSKLEGGCNLVRIGYVLFIFSKFYWKRKRKHRDSNGVLVRWIKLIMISV